MRGKQSKSIAPVQAEVVPPYIRIKQLVGYFENGSLRAKNEIFTSPDSQAHVPHLETSLKVINQLIDRIDRLEESADKTSLFIELMQVLSQLRYHSLMRSEALNRGLGLAQPQVFSKHKTFSCDIRFWGALGQEIDSVRKKESPLCTEDEFNELRRALAPQLLSTASPLVSDIIAGSLAGRAEVVEANPGIGYDSLHGFLNKKERNQLTETGIKFFAFLEEERNNRILSKFLHCVARGEQEKAEKLLKINNEWLLKSGIFTDYSGRTFNCTAYEYAYWAKDTHMQRMLEKYMDANIAREMLERIDAMERINEITNQPVGLTYTQNGEECHSVHFDAEKLIQALKAYVDGFDGRCNISNWTALNAALLRIGLAQRDVVVHIANEYCRLDRLFYPTPSFNEATLPRQVLFQNLTTKRAESWFPLAASDLYGTICARAREQICFFSKIGRIARSSNYSDAIFNSTCFRLSICRSMLALNTPCSLRIMQPPKRSVSSGMIRKFLQVLASMVSEPSLSLAISRG